LKKFRDKYRVDTSRLKGHNYSSIGMYFITICVNTRKKILSEISINVETPLAGVSQIKLTETGKIVEEEWLGLSEYFNNIELDEYIIMPNHVHGIISINKENNEYSLGHIVNKFKRSCTMRIRKIHPDFRWQTRYYDRIIRNERELPEIRRYIRDNPAKWFDDELNVD